MVKRFLLLIALVVPSSEGLRGQEPSRLGLNLSVAGTAQVGVTWQLTNSFAVRPAVSIIWRRLRTPGDVNPPTTTDYGAHLDLLVTVARSGPVSTYLGAGGSYIFNRRPAVFGSTEKGHAVAASGLFGARVRVMERVHLYGELALAYLAQRDADGAGADQVLLRTSPLAVLIFLR